MFHKKLRAQAFLKDAYVVNPEDAEIPSGKGGGKITFPKWIQFGQQKKLQAKRRSEERDFLLFKWEKE